MTLDEFRGEFERYFSLVNKNFKSLEQFFFGISFDLPKFPIDRLKSINQIEYFPLEQQKVISVPIEKIVGNSWLFNKGIGYDGYPKEGKLAYWFSNPSEPIPAAIIDENHFYVNDGNHRIYSAYLRGDSEVKLLVNRKAKTRKPL